MDAQTIEARARQLAAERREDRILAALGGTVGGVTVVLLALALTGRRGRA